MNRIYLGSSTRTVPAMETHLPGRLRQGSTVDNFHLAMLSNRTVPENPAAKVDGSILNLSTQLPNMNSLRHNTIQPHTYPTSDHVTSRFPLESYNFSCNPASYIPSYYPVEPRTWNPAVLYLAAATQLVQWALQNQAQRSNPYLAQPNPASSTALPTVPSLHPMRGRSNTDSPEVSSTSPSVPPTAHSSGSKPTDSLSIRVKRYRCSYPGCSKAYYKRSHLNEHFHLHTGVKPHICNQPGCGARFTRADQLSRHRRAHTGERNFFCTVCLKRFKRSDHLKVHLARNVCTKPI